MFNLKNDAYAYGLKKIEYLTKTVFSLCGIENKNLLNKINSYIQDLRYLEQDMTIVTPGKEEDVTEEGVEADGEHPQVPNMFLCPISKEIMKNPVLLSEDGQTYEKQNILDWYNDLNNIKTPNGDPIEERPPIILPNKGLTRKIKKFLRIEAQQITNI